MAPMRFVGVDGCKGGWFSAGMDENGYDFGIFRGFAELLSHYKDAESHLGGYPNRAAGRQLWAQIVTVKLGENLGYPRQLSVFPTPTRLTAYVAAEPTPKYSTCQRYRASNFREGTQPLSFCDGTQDCGSRYGIVEL